MCDAPQLSVILRFSNRSRFRLRNLQIIIALIQSTPNLEIIISTMELDAPKIPGTIQVFQPGTFESSKANNYGAAAANSDIFVFQDADIIFEPKYYNEILAAVHTGAESVRIADTCVNLGEEKSDIFSKNTTALHEFLENIPDGGRDAPGGCSAITRAAFKRIGGHCELFKVYGWEDTYYRHKLNVLTKRTSLGAKMAHLWHEDNFQGWAQPQNSQLYCEIIENAESCERCTQRDKTFLEMTYKI